MSKDDESRLMAVELAKRLLVDAIWKTASIEVDGISFRDTQEIFEGRAPANMAVDDIIVVNNIKRAWMFLFENVDQPVNWQYMSEYNRILGEGLIRDAGKLRTNDVRIGGTDWIPELPTMKRFVKCFFELLTQIIVKVRKCKVQRVCVLHFQLAGSGGCFFLRKLYH